MTAQDWRHRCEAGLVRLVLAVLRRLGPVRASDMMGGLFRAVGPWLPVSRVAQANLLAALPALDPPARRRVIRAMWESLGRNAGEFPHLHALRQDTPSGPGWEVVNAHVLTEQAARGGPAIFVSGHIGNWEMLPPAVAAYGMPFSSVYRQAANTLIDALILGLRRRAMGQDVPMFAKGARGARGAFMHLRRGLYLGMLVDQKMNDGIEATLFGLPAMTAPAAAAMAVRFGCPVIPGRIQRIGPARLRLVVDPPLMPPPAGGDTQAGVAALTQAINDRLEAWIRERPHEWLWVHRRFPKGAAPAGGGGPQPERSAPRSLGLDPEGGRDDQHAEEGRPRHLEDAAGRDRGDGGESRDRHDEGEGPHGARDQGES